MYKFINKYIINIYLDDGQLVQVEVLAQTEQEIHALLQVQSLPFSWLLSAIYASL